MKFLFYSPFFYEPWDYTNPDEKGIGGSETAQIEMAWRLARRGHEIISFAPLPDDVPKDSPERQTFKKEHLGVTWKFADALASHVNDTGIWVLSRCPHIVDEIPKNKDQKIWLVCQDVDYPGYFTPERLEKIDLILALNPTHLDFLIDKYPQAKSKMKLSGNGLRVELIEATEKLNIQRNPYKMVFTSSPDRGLPALLKVFKRAREFEPRLELVAAYGLDNINKHKGTFYRKMEKEVIDNTKQPGVTWAGRLPQPELFKLIASAGIWPYVTNFTETSCINCMQSQALGAIPVFNPIWALAWNVGHGISIPGNADESLVRCRYTHAIIRLTRYLELQDRIRSEMIPWAKEKFNWENVVDDYENAFESTKQSQPFVDVRLNSKQLAEIQKLNV